MERWPIRVVPLAVSVTGLHAYDSFICTDDFIMTVIAQYACVLFRERKQFSPPLDNELFRIHVSFQAITRQEKRGIFPVTLEGARHFPLHKSLVQLRRNIHISLTSTHV
jgi:hypothetical protein